MARGKRGNKKLLFWLPTKKNIADGCNVLPYNYTRIERLRDRRKYKQVENRCGAHAINNLNLIGKETLVSYEEMDSKATQLAASATRKFGDSTGNWHSSVLQRVLFDKGYNMKAEKSEGGKFKTHVWLGEQTEGKFLALGWVGGDQAHWFCVDADCGLVIDSAEPGYLKHDIAGVLKACPDGVSQVYRVSSLRLL